MTSNRENMSRREALAAIGLMAMSCQTTFGGESGSAAEPAKKGIALQLYTMREPAKKDLPGTLKKAREMGWEYVQWSGMPNLPAEEDPRGAGRGRPESDRRPRRASKPFEKDFDENGPFLEDRRRDATSPPAA